MVGNRMRFTSPVNKKPMGKLLKSCEDGLFLGIYSRMPKLFLSILKLWFICHESTEIKFTKIQNFLPRLDLSIEMLLEALERM